MQAELFKSLSHNLIVTKPCHHTAHAHLQEELAKFLSSAIMASGAAVSSRGRPVIFCRIQRDKNFAFAEVRVRV